MRKNNNKSYYATYHPDGKTAIFDDWLHCKTAVEGVKGIIYKKFTSLNDANLYLTSFQTNAFHHKEQGKQNSVLMVVSVYVDGSYNSESHQGSWAWIALNQQKDKVIVEHSGNVLQKAISCNIDGEVLAATKAMQWASQNDKTLSIHYDYMGIEMWATGKWKARSIIAQEYKSNVEHLAPNHSFIKVQAHSQNKWNDYVDKLAKSVIFS